MHRYILRKYNFSIESVLFALAIFQINLTRLLLSNFVLTPIKCRKQNKNLKYLPRINNSNCWHNTYRIVGYL